MQGDREDDDDAPAFVAPLPPDDRLWRHPSEVAKLAGPPPPPPRPTGRVAPRTIGLALISGVLGAVLTVGVVAVTVGLGSPSAGPRLDQATLPSVNTNLVSQSIPVDGSAAVATTLASSLVRVAVGTGPAIGSAVVLRREGYLLTDAELVGDATGATVTVSGHELPATVVGTDPITDVAVLHVDRNDLTPATFATGGAVVGQRTFVVAARSMGIPGVAAGIVSVLDRKMTAGDGTVLHGMVQTDAPIDATAIGGALADDHGVVLGLVSGPASDSGGYAVPIATARAMADQLIADGYVHHPWLGIEGTDVDASTSMQLHVSGGASVTRVADASPASAAGLQSGDVITAVAGAPVLSMSDLVVGLRAHEPGETVDLEYWRDGEQHHCTATLAERST